jgi:hypothetical protein
MKTTGRPRKKALENSLPSMFPARETPVRSRIGDEFPESHRAKELCVRATVGLELCLPNPWEIFSV